MSKRLFTACLGTETHTWAPLPTDAKAYEDTYLVRGGAHPEAVNMFGVPLKIWRQRAEAKGWQVIEGLCAFATPSGLTVKRTHETLRDEILDELRAAMPVDGVLLSLHGAMVADGYDDCEADLVGRIREITGPDIPIGCELDLHCHISRKFADDVTHMVIFKEYPHVDFAERAEEVWSIMERTLDGEITPKVSVFDCRMIGLYHTTREPMQGFVKRMAGLEGKDGVLSVSLGHGFPWANIPHVGTRVVVITDDGQTDGDALAEKLGRELWSLRDEITPAFVELDDAIERALAIDTGPVVFGDIADNPGGGGAGDSTFIARALLDRGISGAAIGGIWDPMAVQICKGAGVGAELGLRLGGKAGPWSGPPLDLKVRVLGVFDDMLAQGVGNSTRRMGDTVALEADGMEFVVHATRTQNFHPSYFANAGIDWRAKKVLVVKSMQHFYSNYAAVSDNVFYVSTPGVVDHDIRRLPIDRAARPVWPLDEDPWADGRERPW